MENIPWLSVCLWSVWKKILNKRISILSLHKREKTLKNACTQRICKDQITVLIPLITSNEAIRYLGLETEEILCLHGRK